MTGKMRGKIFKSRLFGVILIFALLLPCLFAVPALATDIYPLTTGNSEVISALDYLRAQQGTDGSISDFSTSAWVVMVIAAAGEDPNDWKVGSNPSIVDYLIDNAGTASSTSDHSRMLLAIAAADENPTSFGGIDFLSLLLADYDGSQIGDSSLLNDDFWGVMALIAAGEDPSSAAVQDSLSFIVDNQNGDGGWSWGVGQASDVDDTAAAIMAIIAAGVPAGSTEIDNAIAYIKSMQMDNGGFESWGETNSATDSWGIDGLVAAGEDVIGDDWKSGQDKDPVDDLLTFQNQDGSFDWIQATPSNKELMTAYAITALLGVPYPVAVLPPSQEEGVTIDVRVEGDDDTIWSGMVTVTDSTIVDEGGGEHYLDQPTAIGALDKASQLGDFTYVVQDTAYGLYVYSINSEEPDGLAGWTYRVDYYSSMLGAADFILDQSTPPDPPHQEVLFAYSEWGQAPLRLQVSDTEPAVAQQFTVTVTEYDDDTGTWSSTEGATVYANEEYTTGPDGTVDITINQNLTVEVYAEKEGNIRSNRVTVTVGEGSAEPEESHEVGLHVEIIPAISFSVTPGSIDFGRLAAGDTSTPVGLELANEGAWDLTITATVTDTAENLYVNGLHIDDEDWDEFEAMIMSGLTQDCNATLTVPMNYTLTGGQDGTLIFWASAAP